MIVVDDGSRDEIETVMERYTADPRVCYVKNPKNLGRREAATGAWPWPEDSMWLFWILMTAGRRASWKNSCGSWKIREACCAVPGGN